MTRALVFSLAALATIAISLAAGDADAARARFNDYTTVQDPGLGFSLAYPSGVFAPDATRSSRLGRVFVSPDGKAKLLVGAFDNGEVISLDDYRAYVLEQNYAGAAIDYAPVRKRWFVLSGQRDGTMFYERVSFTCGGRSIDSWGIRHPLARPAPFHPAAGAAAPTHTPGAGPNGGRIINSWAMLYPIAERALYDRVVEVVARTYTPGAGPNGSCQIPVPDAEAPATQ